MRPIQLRATSVLLCLSNWVTRASSACELVSQATCHGVNRGYSVVVRPDLGFDVHEGRFWGAKQNPQSDGPRTVPQFADVTGDGLPDLIVTGRGMNPGCGSQCNNLEERALLFRNTGSLTAAEFTLAECCDDNDLSKVPFFIKGQVSSGAGKLPAFADLDGDGVAEVIGSSYCNGPLTLGPPEAGFPWGRYAWPSDSFYSCDRVEAPSSYAGSYSRLVVADLDGDGLQDLFYTSGFDEDGFSSAWRNVGTSTSPRWEHYDGLRSGNFPWRFSSGLEECVRLDPFEGSGHPYCNVAPAFADVDQDDDLDLVVGIHDGSLLFFENVGSKTSYNFVARTGVENPFAAISAEGGYAAPAFFDFDGDNKLDLVLGSGSGTLRVYARDQPCLPATPCSGKGICPFDPLAATPMADLSPTCLCLTGFAGGQCDECAPTFWGADCEPCPGSSATSTGSSVCNDRGECDDGKTGSGVCTCREPFSGDTCKDGACPLGATESSGRCKCSELHECIAGCEENETPTCVCKAGYTSTSGDSGSCSLNCTHGSYEQTAGQCACGIDYECVAGCGQGQFPTCGCTDGLSTKYDGTCVRCSLGDYCPRFFTEVTDCPAGFYCESPSTKISCEGGSFCPPRSTAPRECSSGYECPGASFESPCPAGTYSVAGSTRGCIPCQAGFFSRLQGSPGCTRCPVGSTSPEGSSSLANCTCVGDHFMETRADGALLCSTCFAGMYQENGTCHACPVGRYKDRIGQQLYATEDGQPGTPCNACPQGMYSDLPGSVQCFSCPAGATTASTGSRSMSACACIGDAFMEDKGGSLACTTCPLGEFFDRTGCKPCPAGSYKDRIGQTPYTLADGTTTAPCAPCPIATFNEVPGAAICKNCNARAITLDVGADRESLCICRLGSFLQSLEGEEPTCMSCEPGSFLDLKKGTCEACPRGMFKRAEGQTLLSLPDGTLSGCELCPPGTVSDSLGQSVCVACASNTYATQPITSASLVNAVAASKKLTNGSSVVSASSSLLEGYGSTTCRSCPLRGAECLNGRLVLDSGFWAWMPDAGEGGSLSSNQDGTASNLELQLFRCPNPKACVTNASTGLSFCAEGHGGVMCGICEAGFVSGDAAGTCVRCRDAEATVALTLFAFVCVLVVVVYLVRKAVKRENYRRGEEGEEDRASAVVKVMVNFLQQTAMLGDFNLDWPTSVRFLFGLMGGVAGMPTTYASQCLFPWGKQGIFALWVSLPPLTLLIFWVWRIVPHCRNVGGEVRGTIRTVLLYLMYPGVSRQAVQMLRCSESVNGKHLLLYDLRLECFSAEHAPYATAAFVTLGYFSLGLPAYIYVKLGKQKRHLIAAIAADGSPSANQSACSRRFSSVPPTQNPMHTRANMNEEGADETEEAGRAEALDKIRLRWSFLYNDFRLPNYAWWSSVEMLRKLALVLVTAIFGGQQSGAQLTFGILVILVPLLLHIHARPHHDVRQQRLEEASLCVSLATLLLALLLFTSDQEGSISSVERSVITAIIMILNTAMFVTFGILIFVMKRGQISYTVTTISSMRLQSGGGSSSALGQLFRSARNLWAVPATPESGALEMQDVGDDSGIVSVSVENLTTAPPSTTQNDYGRAGGVPPPRPSFPAPLPPTS